MKYIPHLYLVLKDGEPWQGERKYKERRLRVYTTYNRARAAIRNAARADDWGRFEIVKFTRTEGE